MNQTKQAITTTTKLNSHEFVGFLIHLSHFLFFVGFLNVCAAAAVEFHENDKQTNKIETLFFPSCLREIRASLNTKHVEFRSCRFERQVHTSRLKCQMFDEHLKKCDHLLFFGNDLAPKNHVSIQCNKFCYSPKKENNVK